MSVTQAKLNPQTYSRLVAKARPTVIKTEEENNRMLAIVEGLIKKGENLTAEEGELLELLANLISDFEDKHYPIKEPTPLRNAATSNGSAQANGKRFVECVRLERRYVRSVKRQAKYQ